MGSLLDEYRRRHKISCIWPVNEGTLFFDLKKKPMLIAITSSFSKSLHICPACPDNQDAIILEIFRVYPFPHCMQRVTHTHMPPDADLLQYVANHIDKGDKFTPYVSAGERDHERWLWQFFLAGEPFKGNKGWELFLADKDQRQEPEWLNQAMWVIKNVPSHFRTFYMNIYSNCLVNRRYILSG